MSNKNTMTSFLNQIFYNCNKFDTIDCIKSLEKYMNISSEKRCDSPPFSEEFVSESTSSFPGNESRKRFESRSDSVRFTPINETTPLLSEKMEQYIVVDEPSILPAALPVVLPVILPSALPVILPVVLPSDNNNTTNLYYPQKKNSLFWCAFISCYGYNEYHLIGNRFSNKELEVKQDIIRYFTENPKHLKNSNQKVTNGLIQEISSELMINTKSSLLECIAFSIFFKKHIFIVKNNTYLLFTFGNMQGSEITADNIVIINFNSVKPATKLSKFSKNQDGVKRTEPLSEACGSKRFLDSLSRIPVGNPSTNEYAIDLEPTMEKIGIIRQEKVLLEHHEKPLKGISTYKVFELEEMARKLQMVSTVSLNKTELYKAVWDTMIW